jgi:hypothetical protein
MTTTSDGDKKSTATATRATAAQAARDNNPDGGKTETFDGTPAEASRQYLHNPTDVAPIGFVFGDDVMDAWAAQIKADDRFASPLTRDPGDTAGDTVPGPLPELLVQYGPGPNDYISAVVDGGQVIVQNGADPTGKAWKYSERDFRRFAAAVRGEPIPLDPRDTGPTQYEEAVEYQRRTNEALAADRDANQRARERADSQPR